MWDFFRLKVNDKWGLKPYLSCISQAERPGHIKVSIKPLYFRAAFYIGFQHFCRCHSSYRLNTGHPFQDECWYGNEWWTWKQVPKISIYIDLLDLYVSPNFFLISSLWGPASCMDRTILQKIHQYALLILFSLFTTDTACLAFSSTILIFSFFPLTYIHLIHM